MIGEVASGYARYEDEQSNYEAACLRQGTSRPSQHEYIDIICGCCHKIIPVPVYCGIRFCPICSVVRQSRVRARLNWLINQVAPQSPYGFSHLTLTVPNMPNLRNMVKHLQDSFRRLRQRSFWKKRVRGGGFVIEITGSAGNWHAHLHIVIEARYMIYGYLVGAWESCSGGTGVYIQRIKKAGIVTYLTKYLTKTGESRVNVVNMSIALKNVRLFNAFGSWYGIFNRYVRPISLCSDCKASDFQLKAVLYTGKFGGSYDRYD